MKRPLLIPKILPSLALILLCSNFSFGQQTIGEFPTMDGGFEKQTINTIGKNNPHATEWSISTPQAGTKLIVTNAAVARTGNKYASFANAPSPGNARLQSPIAPTLATATSYTVQYFFKAAVAIPSLTGAIYYYTAGTPPVNTGNNSGMVLRNPTTFAADTWIKASATFTSPNTTGEAYAAARLNGATATATDVINVDDFVVYAGPLDETAPNAPSGVTVNGLDVSWTAASGGVDGGGYVVVRYKEAPAADNNPNQNGIYNVGNTFTSGTNNLQGTVVFIGNEATTSFTDNVIAGYDTGSNFYKVYTVDKAFNYSSSAVVAALGTNQWSLDNPISIYPNPVNENQFTISLPSSISGKATVGIYNISGQLVYKTNVEGTGTIAVRPTQSLEAGVYIVKVENNGNSSTQKITIR